MLLATCLKARSLVTRFLVIKQMTALYRRKLVDDFHDWCVPLLVEQLSYSEGKVALVALDLLRECSKQKECMEAIIKTHCYEPLSQLEAGKDLLFGFLSKPSGFHYVRSHQLFDQTAY